jgi:hypothetical protein
MSHEQLFSLAGSAAMAGWLLLALVPLRFGWPQAAAAGIALLISALYAALIGVYWTRAEGGFGSLADVARLFEHRGLLLAGWVHYLAFDLLVGVWIRGEAGRIALPQAFVVPCLLLTFLFGPVGWLLFMAFRLFRLRTSVAAPVPG